MKDKDMIKVLFICHGNICRSPMAEMIFKDIVRNNNMENFFLIDSMATSREEIGNDIYPPAKRMMELKGIPYEKHCAVQVKSKDMEYYDYIIIMDPNNYNNIKRMFGNKFDEKVHFLLSFAGENRAVSDPWYTGDFEKAYDDIRKGCLGLYNLLVGKI